MQFDTITRDEALQQLFAQWNPSPKRQTVAVNDAVGYICYEDIFSENIQPVFRASQMDGIAIKSKDFASGVPDTSQFKEGRDYVRADTGDDFSDDFDAVIRIENVTINEDGSITLKDVTSVAAGDNVEKCGGSLNHDDLLLPKGWRIRPVDIATLVRGGISDVPVVCPPRICFIPTGNELVPAGTKPQRGQVVDCNSALAKHVLADMGAEVTCLPIVKDSLNELESALDNALAIADIVLINGGSSKGKDDYNTRLLRMRGNLLNHGVAAAPGRPMAIAIIDGKPVINVPGPMVACCYVFDWCLRPVIAHALGTRMQQHPIVRAKLTRDIGGREGMQFWNRVDLRVVKESDDAAGAVGAFSGNLDNADNFTSNNAGNCTGKSHVLSGNEVKFLAEPVSLHREGGFYRIGVSSGQIISNPSGETLLAGSDVDVELLCDIAYLPRLP
ncbi:MAG: molybdopterin molybdotransferase MoeA [Coriobacteriales bacterium]|jgi:molybdopterin molybdotransferase/putative molybdopterin biosynthesis protein|nr:molybdopterin molybdotransferase MoeA [Coriobacteriales bacterium]